VGEGGEVNLIQADTEYPAPRRNSGVVLFCDVFTGVPLIMKVFEYTSTWFRASITDIRISFPGKLSLDPGICVLSAVTT
jgi:hypothetical protein